METVRATVWWPPEIDVLHLYVEPPIDYWMADPVGKSGLVALYQEVDEHDEETGRVVGLEIIDFLEFSWWDDIPDLRFLWQLPDEEPMPLVDLLKRVQLRLREKYLSPTHG